MRSQRQADVHYFFNNSMTWTQLFCLFYDFCALRHCLEVLFQDIWQVFLLKMLLCHTCLLSYYPLLCVQNNHCKMVAAAFE